MNLDLDFFEPRSIAVIGASAKEGSYASRPLKNLVDRAYNGRLYVVNPRAESVIGITSYASIADLPETPDLVLIAVNAGAAVTSLREAGQRGVKNAIILAGGFKESGNPEGEVELRKIAQKFKMSVIGPNCTGVISVIDNVCASSTLFFRQGSELRPGPVSIITQSGGTGISLLRACADRRIGLGYYLSVGNQSCVSAVECANVLLDSSKVRVIALYVEGLGGSGRDLLDLGAKARRLNKSVLVFKAGISSLGRQLAVTHTGALSGPGDVIPTLISRAGLVYTETHEELADVMALESFASFEHRRALAVISTGGGFTVMSADACSKYGVPLAQLSRETSDKMRPYVPPFASVDKNPVDTTPFDVEGTGLGACEVLLQAPETDCVLLVLGGEDLGRFLPRLRELAQIGRVNNTPLIVGLAGVDGFGILDATLKDAVADAGVPVFGSPVRAVRALSLIGPSDQASGAVEPENSARDDEPQPSISTLAPTPQYLNGLLAKYGVAVPQQCVILLEENISASTSSFKFPVVLKLVDQGSSNHKSEKGWLQLNLKSPEELEAAAERFRQQTERIRGDRSTLRLQVQEQVSSDAVEVLVGAMRHPEFGPVITVGTGGVLAELAGDVDYALAPIDTAGAQSLLRRTKVGRRIQGYRGDRGYDELACAEAVVAVSKILGELGALDEVEINPLIVGRSGAIAVDVRGTFASA